MKNTRSITVTSIIIFGMFISLFNPFHRLQADTSMNSLMHMLASSDLRKSSNAVNKIFNKGDEAIPYLISGLSDRRRFFGDCGSSKLHPTWEFYPTDNVKTPISTEQKYEPIQIREVCLYILISISKNDLYFAKSCDPKLEGSDLGAILDDVFVEISEACKKSNQDSCAQFDLTSIEKVMLKYKVKFE